MQLKVTQGQGRHVEMPCFAEAVYGRIEAMNNVNMLNFHCYNWRLVSIAHCTMLVYVVNSELSS